MGKTSQTVSQTPTHNPGGGFAKGNKASRGNAISLRQAAYRRAMHQAVTLSDVDAICKHLISVAKGEEMQFDGETYTVRTVESIAAARLLFEYTMGKPKPVSDEAASPVTSAPLEQVNRIRQLHGMAPFTEEEFQRRLKAQR